MKKKEPTETKKVEKSSKPLTQKLPKRNKVQTAEGWKRSMQKRRDEEEE